MFNPLIINKILCQTQSFLTITIDNRLRQIKTQTNNKTFNRIPFFTPSVKDMYSASVVGKATVGCKEAFQLIAHPNRVKM